MICPSCGSPALDGHITCGKAACNERGHRDRYLQARFQAPIPMENLLPRELVHAYQHDVVVNACFKRASYMAVTREQALIWTVEALVDARRKELDRFREYMERQPPAPIMVVKDGGTT